MSHSSNHFAIVMVVLAGIMWAGSGIGAQNFFEKCSMNAMELTAFRMIATGCILIGVTVWQGKMKESLICLRKKPRLWIDIVIYAIVGLMLMHYTYFEAIAYGNAATATVVLYSCPAMVICYNAIRHHKLPSKEEAITVLLAVGGTYLLVTGGDPSKLSVSFLCIALALFNGVVYSFASIYPKHIFLQVDKTFVLAVSMIIGALACWAFVPQIDWLAFFDPHIFFGVAWIVLFGTVTAFLLYNAGLMYLSPQQALITAASEPAASVILSCLIFGMSFVGLQVVGILMVILAIIMPAVDLGKLLRSPGAK